MELLKDKSLRLADALDYHREYDLCVTHTGIDEQAAAELRRLHALNASLLTALKEANKHLKGVERGFANVAIAKAEAA